jgi:hypothetical protein
MADRRKKKFMRRKMAQAFGHQQKAIQCMLEVRELFVEWHPEWSPMFNAICNNCMMTAEFIQKLCIQAWGYFPESLDTWLK